MSKEMIDSIMAEAETAEAVEQSQESNSLMEAHSAGTSNNEGDTRKRERTPREAIPAADKLTESESIAREWEEDRKEHRGRVASRREPSLAEALEGVTPEETVSDIPESLTSRFSIDDITAAMNVTGLTAEDLSDERWLAVLEQRLEEEAAANAEEGNDSEDDGPETELEEADEEAESGEKAEEKTEEAEKKAETAAPIAHRELLPEEVDQYVEKTWAKAEQINNPQMSKVFSGSLAELLGGDAPQSEPERLQKIDAVCKLLEYGGVSLVQSAAPALIDEYMQEHFVPNLMRNIGPLLETYLPGITASHHSQQARAVWDQVRQEADQFADLPDFDSKEFSELRDKIRQENPWIDTWTGGPGLSPQQDLKARAQLFARLAAGDRVNPKAIAQQVADAHAAGKKSAERSARRITGSAMRGSNGRRGTSSIGEQKERAGLMDAWNEKHGKGSEGI